MITSSRAACATSGRISGFGLARARIIGLSAIDLTMAASSTSGPDMPRNTSAPLMASARARAVFSSAASTCNPLRGPSRIVPGFVPKKAGVNPPTCPSTTVKLSDKWCPSNRQLQVPSTLGLPKMLTKYHFGSRAKRPFGLASCSTCSRLMICAVFCTPRALITEANSA